MKSGRLRRQGSSMGAENSNIRLSHDPSFNHSNKNNRFFMAINNNNINHEQDEDQCPQQEMFFLDDDSRPETNGRMLIATNPSANNGKLRSQLEPLRINIDKFMQNVGLGEEESLEIVKAFSLCHQAYITYLSETKFNATSRINSEEVLLKLISSIGINIYPKIEHRSFKEYGL